MKRIIHGLAEEREKAILWSALLALGCLAVVCWRAVPDGGDRLAANEFRGPANGQTCEGLRPDTVDGDSLPLLAPSGTRTRVRRGAERTFNPHPTVFQSE